jgi:hypothetical protein
MTELGVALAFSGTKDIDRDGPLALYVGVKDRVAFAEESVDGSIHEQGGSMFCSECGAAADGKFCWKCGTPLHGGATSTAVATATVESPTPPAPVDWSAEVRYDVLVAQPVVRDLLARQAGLAKKPLSGDALLQILDKLALTPIPTAALNKIVVPFWVNRGIKSQLKTNAEVLFRPCGHVIAAALCSFARQSLTLSNVDQADNGCTLHAEQPSDFRSNQGEVKVTIVKHDGATHVEAGAWCKGQIIDYGKSAEFVKHLFEDLRTLHVTG